MDATLALTGMLPFVLLVSGALTAIVSAVLLYRYRRATIRGMRETASSGTGAPVERERARSSLERLPVALSVRELRGDDLSATAKRAARAVESSQLSASLVYLLGGLAYAAVMSAAWIAIAADGIPLGRVLWLPAVFLWPAVIGCAVTLAVDDRERIAIAGVYLLALALVAAFVLQRNPGLPIAAPFVFWAIVNLPSTALFLVFLLRRIRSVGPLVFAFMLAGVGGAVVLVQAIGGSDAALAAVARLGMSAGLNATGVFVALQALGFVTLGALCWVALRRLGAAYRHKRFGDQSIVMDSTFAVFAVAQSVSLAFDGLLWALAGPLAFAAYRLVVALGFARLAAGPDEGPAGANLLLLRVFSLGRRSDRFFDAFSKLWRRRGTIGMIAGPDLVTAAVEPHEFLDYVAGRLSRRFVKDETDLRRRLAALDRRPDPDLRYRVHEFFCHDDTWRMTMQSLAHGSAAILMDLRSFSEANRGCLYELGVLLDSVDLRRVVFLVDRTTDRDFLERSFERLWRTAASHSPNVRLAEPTITLYHADRATRRALRTLVGTLIERSTDARVPISRSCG